MLPDLRGLDESDGRAVVEPDGNDCRPSREASDAGDDGRPRDGGGGRHFGFDNDGIPPLADSTCKQLSGMLGLSGLFPGALDLRLDPRGLHYHNLVTREHVQ